MHDVAQIRRVREGRGLSQAQAARRAKISPQQWNHIERGRVGMRRGISLALLGKVARALDVSAKDLLD